MARFYHSLRLDPDLGLLTLVVLLQNLPYFDSKVLPVHDTMWSYSVFHSFYCSFLYDFEIPQWVQYGLYGAPTIASQLSGIKPSSCIAGLIGFLFDSKDTLALFKISVFVDQLMFLLGIYLLSMRLFVRRITRLLVCLGGVCGTVWLVQIGFSFLIYYLVPLCLYFIFRYFDEKRPEFLWLAGIVTILSYPGAIGYGAAVHLLLYTTVFIIMLVRDRTAWRPIFSLSFGNLAMLLIFISTTAVFVHFTGSIFDYQIFYHETNNNGVAFQASPFLLKTFLTHGEDIIASFKFPEFIFGYEDTSNTDPLIHRHTPLDLYLLGYHQSPNISFRLLVRVRARIDRAQFRWNNCLCLVLFPGNVLF